MILVIDNYDSFTYNLVQIIGGMGERVNVYRNDAIEISEVTRMQPDGILLSPGPCSPNEAGICLDITKLALQEGSPLFGIPLFGVCLGHQTIGHISGGMVTKAGKMMHGKTSMVEHDGQGVFEGMPNPFCAVRYHSLIVREETLPADFVVTARSLDDKEVMGLRHQSLPIHGVQFHPESFMTQDGERIVKNFVALSRQPV